MEKSDFIDILENTLGNRNSENERLKEELKKANERMKEYLSKDDNTDDQDSDSNIATTSAKKSLTCEKCEYVVISESDMERHISMYHVFECDYCEFIRDTEEELEHHVLEKHDFYCEYCDFDTNSEADFDSHMKERHGTNQRPWSCDACKLKFRTKAKIVGHICKHELKNPSFGKILYKELV